MAFCNCIYWEKIDHEQRENGARNIYSNYNQIKAYFILAGLVSEFSQYSSLTLSAYTEKRFAATVSVHVENFAKMSNWDMMAFF